MRSKGLGSVVAKQDRKKTEHLLNVERAAATTIKRLTREITQLETAFRGDFESKDAISKAYDLETRRDDLIRSSVLHLHTYIEDQIDSLIMRKMLNVGALVRPNQRGRALKRMISGGGSLGFDMKLNFAVALGVMNEKTRRKLMELNTLRNRCSHHHTLTGNVREGKRPGQKKPPLLNFRGRRLHSVPVFEEFAAEYWELWLSLGNQREKLMDAYFSQYKDTPDQDN